MAYRKIVVDGSEYKYVVGKTHVKIHGMQAVPMNQIGACVHGDRWAVTPLRVATYIRLGHVPDHVSAPPILEQESVAHMNRIAKQAEHSGDYESPHQAADDLLCEVLTQLGYGDLVNAYIHVPKWHA